MAGPLTNYETHSWSTYPISMDEGHDLPTVSAMHEFVEMPAESPIAEQLSRDPDYDPTKMFFADFEQAAHGRTVHPHGPLMRLTHAYRGHEAGKLAWVAMDGLDDDPPTYLLYLEN